MPRPREEQGYFLLMDDGRPYQYAKARGIRVVGTLDLVVVLYDGQKVTLQRYCMDQAIQRYQEGALDLSGAAQTASLSIRELGVDIYGPESRGVRCQ